MKKLFNLFTAYLRSTATEPAPPLDEYNSIKDAIARAQGATDCRAVIDRIELFRDTYMGYQKQHKWSMHLFDLLAKRQKEIYIKNSIHFFTLLCITGKSLILN